ncbi:MAG TPA: PEPxxWA-CTERM sorting domain-containing protein [Gemmatimonas sp.]|nr:PEPxxWA-CTERM sorting domain-containing protein [Gemmatimonas sp.]
MRFSARVVAVAALVSAPMALSAQVVASDASYTITRSTGHAFNSIAGTGAQLVPDMADDAFASVPIQTFSFYGNVYNTVYVSTNGMLAFGAVDVGAVNSNFSTPQLGTPIVAAYWDDLLFDGPAALYGLTVDNVTTIEWNSALYYFDTNNRVTFQAIINSASGVITLNYGDVDGGVFALGAQATVGTKGPSTFALVGHNTSGTVNSADRLTIAPVGTSTVPEPTTWALMLGGLGAVGFAARRRRSQSNN